MPAGRIAEDGIIPDRYPDQELAAGGYRRRTLQNVLDSDGRRIPVVRVDGGARSREVELRFEGGAYPSSPTVLADAPLADAREMPC